MKLPLPQIVAHRHEQFGGILATVRPRALVHVDRAMMRRLGFGASPLWDAPEQKHLAAPTEVHLVLSRRCSAGCKGCYVDATPHGDALSLGDACAILGKLAALGVFHVALGGGEALDDPELLFAVADHARAVGIVPNLTTAGLNMTPELAARCAVFGQINVSVDGVGERYREARGFDGYDRAERALRLLRAVTSHVGINYVVSRSSYDGIDDVAKLAKRLKLSELELLRFKPAGRGAPLFDAEDLTAEQAWGIYPKALKIAFRYRLRTKLDCSFAPMVFAHDPPAAVAAFFGVQGCVGGDVLAAVHPDGALTGCSFGGPREADARTQPLDGAWQSGFGAFRDYVDAAPEPCRDCHYLALCRGGCRVVAAHKGRWSDPDPGCPRVRDFRAANPPATKRVGLPLV